MKYFLLTISCLLTMNAFSQSFSSARYESSQEKREIVEDLISKNRCQISINGEEKDLELEQDVGIREPMNPLLRYSNYAGYYVIHQLSVFKGEKPNSLSFKLIKKLPQRGVNSSFVKTVQDVDVDNLSLKLNWEISKSLFIECI